jgi:hypothetical protein
LGLSVVDLENAMAPSVSPAQAIDPNVGLQGNVTNAGSWRIHASPDAFVLEAWSEGCMVGALMIMSFVTLANMRRGVLLHKLILLEVSYNLSFNGRSSYSFRPALASDYARHFLLYGL